ncbi:MAG: type II toxin-antitoxin system Phd/YefM family antitoxin [Actinomycetota bacterium]|nr:type II toxin-antitoxin system Phd/YefM family antitoxin [Actinomycetota bacterium]
MTATEASPNFAALLDTVEAGETVIVTRNGAPVARLEPEDRTSGRRLTDLMDRYAGDQGLADALDLGRRHVRDVLDDTPRTWPA